jgi:uncharacterized membrane protein YqiK
VAGGTVVQAATSNTPRAAAARMNDGGRIRRRSATGMIWFLLEMLVALAIAIFIVWWTMGLKTRKPPDDR